MKAREGLLRIGALALAAALSPLAATRVARAQPSALELEWEAPPGCPSTETVRKRVRTLVGPALDSASRVRAQGRIERIGTRYRLLLRMGELGAETEREIESNSCSDLGGAAAVALSLLVRGELSASGTGGEGQANNDAGTNASDTQPPNEQPAQSTKTKAAEPAPDEPSDPGGASLPSSRGPSFRFLLRAPLAGVDVGPLPKPSPTFGLAVGMRFEGLELTLGGRVALQQTVRVDDYPGFGAELTRVTAELRGCHTFRSSSFGAGPCLVAALEVLSATGLGNGVVSRTESALGFAAGAGAVARVELGEPLALVASAGLLAQATRAQVVVDGLGEVTRVAPFALTLSGGLEWTL